MRPLSRASVAYIAGKIITNSRANRVFDFSAGKDVEFRGEISASSVDIQTTDGKCQVSGGAYGSNYSLYDFSTAAEIELEISGRNFKGTDAATKSKFEGSVTGKTVTIVDSKPAGTYLYDL